MGCGIHLLVEKKNKDGKWCVSKDVISCTCRFCKGTGKYYENRECTSCINGSGNANALEYDDKDYFMFSILANVRNEKEGCEGYVAPISNPRGIPDDYSQSLSENVSGGYSFDETHSNSYHTLKQLKEYDWENSFVGFFYDEFMPALQKLSDECGGDENVRIVFGFDN